MYDKTIISELDYNPSVKVWDDEPHIICVDQGYSGAVYPIEEAREMIEALQEAVAYAESLNKLENKLNRLPVGSVIRWSNGSIWFRANDAWRNGRADHANVQQVKLFEGRYTFEVIV